SNAGLVPQGNLSLGGGGANRMLTISPAANQTGTARITVTVSDGALSTSGSFILTVNAPSSTPPPTVVNLVVEAESGALSGPVEVSSSLPSTVGLAAVTAPAAPATFIETTVANQGTASYRVNLPGAGQYIIWCRVYAPSAAHDSFFVSVDGGPVDVYDLAEGTWSASWQWSRVNGRDGGDEPLALNPRTFNLSAGTHTITFR